LARQAGEGREALVALSVALFNLGIYYQQADRHDQAVRALEEVVALDERTGHPDLEQDREALRSARMLAAMSPEERERLRGFAAQAEQTMAQMTPEEHAALEQASVEQMLHTMAGQIGEAASAALRGQVDRAELMDRLKELARQLSGDEQLGAARHDAIAYVQAIVALLNNRPVPNIPAAYKEYIPK
jgi:tetratricopeptide (TPR) repeat protein